MRHWHSRCAAVAAAAMLAAGCGAQGDSSLPPLGANKLTVIVLVVDSLMPSDISAGTTPELEALRAGGTSYEESRAVYAAETIPNHVAMMTGVYPERSGIPTNDFIDDFSVASPEPVKLSIPERLTANTMFTWIDHACGNSPRSDVRTGATLSKKYLHDIFAGDAADAGRANDNPNVFNLPPESFWSPEDDPAYIDSPDEHVPDIPTMSQALTQLPDVDFFFINLGDVDRSAHAGGQAARSAVLPDTDAQVGALVDELQASGRWASTVLFVVSDHGMDFSAAGPATVVTSQAMLDSLGACFEPMIAVPSGGTESISVLDRGAPLGDRQAALRAARACLLGEGCACGATAPPNAGLIEGAWYTVMDALDADGTMPPAIASGHANLGDLTVFAKSTGKFGDPPMSPDFAGSFIPGNHGHPVTLHNTFIVSGGSPWVKTAQSIAASVASPTALDRLPEQSENVDLAPTIAWLLGLDLPAQEFPDYAQRAKAFDGRILKEAFTQFDADPDAPPPTVCGRFE